MRAYLGWSLLFILNTLFWRVEMVQVNVTQGTLEGEILTTIVGNITYYSFKGIPYAASPIGNLRFKAPEAPANWTGVRNATSYGSVCPQKDVITDEIKPGSEDCLFLNVFSCDIAPTTPLPVIVFIHGGGFESGSGSDYKPDFLVSHGVVLVTINYRLGALGFLSLDTKEVPGNAGLKDQVAALKWVKENIASFGGDPDNVTIMGQSAGGASVTYHLVSPLSKGLFKRGIAMSGTFTCSFVTEFEHLKRARLLGEQTGLQTNDTTDLLTHLQNVSVDLLYNTNCTVLLSEITKNNDKLYTLQFTPLVEKHCDNNTFLSKSAEELLKNGSICNEADMLVGYTNYETVTLWELFISTYLDTYRRNLEMFVPAKVFLKVTGAMNLDLGAMIRKQYLGNSTIDVNVISNFISCTSDASFNCPIINFMNLLPATCNNTRYFYEFGMSSGINFFGNQAKELGYSGYVGHTEDLFYVLPNDLVNTTLLTENSTELLLVNEFCTLISNFATHGNPTPSNSSTLNTTWPQFDKTNQSYLEIGNTLTVKANPKADVMDFWRNIYKIAGVDF